MLNPYSITDALFEKFHKLSYNRVFYHKFLPLIFPRRSKEKRKKVILNAVSLLFHLINFRNIEQQRASQNRQRTKGHGKTC